MSPSPTLTDIRSSLLRTPNILRQMTATLSDDALRYREAPDAWNILEVLAHVADGEVHDWIPRVSIILSAGPDKRFTPFDREAGAVRYKALTVAQLLSEFERLRSASVQRLDAFAIREDQLALEGIHPEFGPVTLRQLLNTWTVHDYGHIAQISRLLVRYHGEHVGPWTKYFSLLVDRPNKI